MMRIDVIDGQTKSTPAFVAFINARLTAALDRFDPRVAYVRVKIDDANGPRGGIDKHCAIRARLNRGGMVMAEEHDADYYTALDRAVGKLKRAMSRRVDRRKRK